MNCGSSRESVVYQHYRRGDQHGKPIRKAISDGFTHLQVHSEQNHLQRRAMQAIFSVARAARLVLVQKILSLVRAKNLDGPTATNRHSETWIRNNRMLAYGLD